MKLSIFFLTTIFGFQDESAFAFTTSFGVGHRTTTSLTMNVEKIEKSKEIRVGVIGAGRIGLVHLEAITKAPGVTPVIISNPTVSKAEKGKLGFWSFLVFKC